MSTEGVVSRNKVYYVLFTFIISAYKYYYYYVTKPNLFAMINSISNSTQKNISGEVTLERPVEEIAAISHAGTPILLTVVAEEVRLSREEPEAMSSTVQLAFILPERENSPPYFENEL